VSLLRSPINMEIIPHLRDLRAAIVQRPLARCGLVVPRARAAHIRRGAVLGAESFFESGERVRGAVGRDDGGVGEPFEGVEAAVVHYDGFEEVDDFFVFGIFGAVAGDVEGREAGGVFGEFVLGRIVRCVDLASSWLVNKRMFVRLTPQRSWLGEFCAIQYVFMYSRRS
jgi:hypothetical protein